MATVGVKGLMKRPSNIIECCVFAAPNGLTTPATVTDNGNETYNVEYTPSDIGIYQTVITDKYLTVP